MKLASRISTLTLIAALASGLLALAQPAPKSATDAAPAKPAQEGSSPKQASVERPNPDNLPERTIYIRNTSSPNDANEYVTAIRNTISPYTKVYLVPSQNAIIIRATPEDTALALKILDDLDRPKKTYRLTYTVTEMDGDKRVGAQHYSMVMASGQQASLKQGDRVPIATSATASKDAASAGQTQLAYQDIGMSFDATLDDFREGARLRSIVEQSSLADEKSGFGQQDPVFRHTVLRGEAILTPGKPLVLGTMDVPGSTRHLVVEALLEPLP